jgi:hypothetical protein
MSPLQFLAWLAQTVTFTGIALCAITIGLSVFYPDLPWLLLALVPATVISTLIWFLLRSLSSVIVRNETSKLGWSLMGIWLFIHIIVYVLNFDEMDELIIEIFAFNTVYLVGSAIVLYVFQKPSQEVVKQEKHPFFHIRNQIVLSISIAVILITWLILR